MVNVPLTAISFIGDEMLELLSVTSDCLMSDMLNCSVICQLVIHVVMSDEYS